MNANNEMKTGDVVICSVAFTSPIGCHFAKGSMFEVLRVGSVNTLMAHVGSGSLVWFTDGHFVTR